MGSVQSSSVSDSLSGSVGSFLEYDRVLFHLNPGDLIEVHRGRYRHWVLCEDIDESGTVWCFHVTAVGQYDPELDAPFDESVRITKEVSFNGKAWLKYQPLDDILRDTPDQTLSKCRVNNQTGMALKMLNAVRNQAPDITQVFKRLHELKDRLFSYDLKSLNCEHYCTLWKYGIGWSSQVNTFKDIITAGLKFVSTAASVAADWSRANGCYRIGLVCLLISTVASMAAQVIDGIDFTLKSLRVEQFIRHAIAN